MLVAADSAAVGGLDTKGACDENANDAAVADQRNALGATSTPLGVGNVRRRRHVPTLEKAAYPGFVCTTVITAVTKAPCVDWSLPKKPLSAGLS